MTQNTQTTPKPLPCPFCGAEKVAIAEGSTYRWAYATCTECGAAAGDIRRQYGQGTDDPEVQQAAIVEWNTRDRREIDALKAEVERLRPGYEAARVAGWQTVWDLQTKHVNTWRDKAEWYWFARFSEEVGELGGALVGNHVGPVEWELSQIAAIALNWLDMRAATERRRDE